MSNLLRLTYASTATFEPVYDGPGIEVSVARILMQSRRNNPRRRLGGVLHYGDGYFFQCLEGPRDAVNETYQRIMADHRHRDVQLISARSVAARLFARWSMKYVPVEDAVQGLLARHGLRRFQPYAFTEQLVHELLKECILGADPTTGAIPQVSTPNVAAQARPGFWRRLAGQR